MAIHSDHNGNTLNPDQVDVYWRGFIQGKDSLKPDRITKFIDETGFEMYLKSMGWELCELDYPTDYFTSYGTVTRYYKKGDNQIGIGLIGKSIGIYYPTIENSSLPLPGEYDNRLKEILN